MAMIVNKMLRVIPKTQKIASVDCHALCTKLAITGGELWEKVIYYVNEEENCLDVKFKSRRGGGELGIEKNKDEFDIWEIANFEGGPDYIYCLNAHQYDLNTRDNVNLYCFDEVRISGNHDKLLLDLYPQFFHFRDGKPSKKLNHALQEQNDSFLSFKLEGIYTACTSYQVGDIYSKEPELMSKEKFFRPVQVFYWEPQFLYYNHRGNYSVQKFLEACQKDQLRSLEWDRDNLHEIQYCYRGRVVKKIEIGKHWLLFNSEFFDNSVKKNWLEYMGLYNRGLV